MLQMLNHAAAPSEGVSLDDAAVPCEVLTPWVAARVTQECIFTSEGWTLLPVWRGVATRHGEVHTALDQAALCTQLHHLPMHRAIAVLACKSHPPITVATCSAVANASTGISIQLC